MPTKISTYRLEDPYLEVLDALAALHDTNRTEVIRMLLRRVKIADLDIRPEADRARAAVAALREQK